jgi:seryl-tRNA synthetase
MDAYSIVKTQNEEAETLATEANQLWQRWRAKSSGKSVGIRKTLNAIDEWLHKRNIPTDVINKSLSSSLNDIQIRSNIDGDSWEHKEWDLEGITPQKLTEIVVGMTYQEAMHIIHATLQDYLDRGISAKAEIDDILQVVHRIDYRSKKSQHILKRVCDGSVISDEIKALKELDQPAEEKDKMLLEMMEHRKEMAAQTREVAKYQQRQDYLDFQVQKILDHLKHTEEKLSRTDDKLNRILDAMQGNQSNVKPCVVTGCSLSG